MALFLDLESLASLLDEEPETDVEAEEQEPVNSYLLHEVLPLLELGLYPRLADIDYDEFECYDPAALLGYIEESGATDVESWRTHTQHPENPPYMPRRICVTAAI